MERIETDSLFLKKLKRIEILILVLDKLYFHAKETGSSDVMRRMMRYDIIIDRDFRSYTRENLIDLLQDKDEQQRIVHSIQDRIVALKRTKLT